MALRSGHPSGKLGTSGIKFNAFQRYSEEDEWTQTAINETNTVSWNYDTEKDLYIRLQISSSNAVRYSFQGDDDYAFSSAIKSTIVRWDRDELEFFMPKGQTGANWEIYAPYQQTIPLTLLPAGTCKSIGKTFEPPQNDSSNNIESTIKIRPVEPYSLTQKQPSITYGTNGGNISMDAVWNEAKKGFDVKFTYNRISDISLKFQAEIAMATEKYGAFGDLGKSLSVTPVSTDTVVAVLARGKTDMNAVTFADLEAYLNDKPINPSDACDMCAYALYATAGVNNVVWCGGTDLAACIKTFQDYMTRTPQVSCIVIDGGFTTSKEDAATILAGIKKIDGHWDATAILNCNAAQDRTGKPCSSEDAVVTMGFIKTGANVLPLSAIRAGLCARSDAEYGAPARSGGNLPIPNAEAWGSYDSKNFTAMPISETLATSLSAEGVCAVVNYSGTYRTWGDHTSLFAAGAISDERARFDNSIRMLRSITNRFQLKYRASIDSPFTLQMRNDIINEQLDYLNGLVAKGALIGKPTCEFRAIDNPKDNIQKGEFKWNITCTTTNPLKYAYVSVSYTSAGLDSLVEEG